MKNSNTLMSVFKTIHKTSPLIEHLSKNEELNYDGFSDILESFDTKVDSKLIVQLIDKEVLDYDEFQSLLTLDYQTSEFVNHLRGTDKDINIEAVNKQIQSIKNSLLDVRRRKNKNENYNKERRNIIKRLRNIPSILKYNYITVRNSSVISFQTENNIEIKKNHLKNCKKELNNIVDAFETARVFITKKRKILHQVIEDNRIIDMVLGYFNEVNKAIVDTRKDISFYLNKTLENENLLKKIKKIGSLNKQGLLEENTNIQEVFGTFYKHKKNTKKSKLNLIRDCELIDFQDKIRDEIERRDIRLDLLKIGAEKKVYDEVDTQKKVNLIQLVDFKNLYKKFYVQDELDFVNYLVSLKVEENKISPLVAKTIIEYHINLEIDVSNRVVIRDMSYPTITQKIKKRF